MLLTSLLQLMSVLRADCALRRWDPDHADICWARAALAATYWSVGRRSDAVPLMEQALLDSINIYGSQGLETRIAEANLAYY